MKELILLLIGSVVMNNCVLQGYLGVTSAMGNAKCPCKCIKLGLSVTAVMVLTTLITWPIQNFVLAPFGLEYFRTMLFVLVILALDLVALVPDPVRLRVQELYKMAIFLSLCRVLGLSSLLCKLLILS